MAGNNYGVDSFHVVVGTGDCAIHLMTHRPDENKPRILAAVLIDGGSKLRQGKGANPIGVVAEWIQQKYTTGYDNNILKFCAVVVTHWDEDHYKALMDYFFLGVKGNGKNARHPNLVYGPETDKANPLTWLYTPYWQRYYHFQSKRWVNGKPDFMSQKSGTVIMNTKNDDMPPLSDGAPIFRLRTIATEIGFKGTPKDVIGVNLFNNTGLKPQDFDTVKTWTNLWNKNLPTDPTTAVVDQDAPGLYIVAANRRVLGGEEVPWIWDPPYTAPTLTNQSSIVALVMWKDHISHYIAGDADGAFEEALHKKIFLDHDIKITSMKLSHHGSRHSTPMTMIDRFKPENVLVSNPISGYPHPAWQVVWLLDAWYRANKPQDATGRARRIFATRYPHYLFRDVDFKNMFHRPLVKQMGGALFTPEMMGQEAYKTDKFCTLYDKLAEEFGGPGVIEQLEAMLKPWNKTENSWLDIDVFQALAAITENLWNRTGFPNLDSKWLPWVEYIPNGSKTFIGADTLSFLMVLCRPKDHDQDGIVVSKLVREDDWFFANEDEEILAASSNGIQEEAVSGDDNIEAEYIMGSDLRDPLNNNNPPQFMFLAAGGPVMGTDTSFSNSVPRRLPTRGLAMSVESVITDAGTDINEMGTDGVEKPDQPFKPAPKLPTKPVKIPAVGYALFANNAFSRLKPTGDSQHFGKIAPDLGFNLDIFVGSLKTAVLSLASNPTTTAADANVAFASNDALAAWLSDAVGMKSMTAAVDKKGTINSFSAALGTSDQLSLTFSSDKSVLQTTFNDKDMTGSSACAFDEPGLMENATILCFGLKSFTGATTLGQLANLMGLKALAKSLPIQLLSVLKLQPYFEAGHRNAIWFDPVSNYDTNLRLQLQIAEDSKSLIKTLLQYLDPKTLDLQNNFVIANKVCMYEKSKDGIRVVYHGAVTFVTDISILGTKFQGIIKLSDTSIRLTLSILQETSVLSTIVSWIQKLLKESEGSNQEFDGAFSQWLNNKIGGSALAGLQPRSLTLELACKANAKNELQVTSISSIQLDIELNLKYGNSANPVVFMATYVWKNRPKSSYPSLSASLTTSSKPLRKTQLLPEWEKFLQLDPVTVKTPLPEALDLAALSGIQDFPDGLPSQVTQAQFSISSDEIAFGGRMRAKPATHGASVPMISLSNVELAASYGFGDVKPWNIEFGFRVLLSPKPEAVGITPAEITGSVVYQNVGGKTAWKLKGQVEALSGHLLYSFFDSDSNSAVAELIGGISIRSLTVDYDYAGKNATNFTITGLIGLGPVDLALKFITIKTEGKDQSTWSFEANLSLPKDSDQKSITASGEDTSGTDAIKLGTVLDSLLGQSDVFPPFIANIEFARPKAEDRISLVLAKDTDAQPARLVFFVDLEIAGFSFAFLQCKEVSSDEKQKLPAKRAIIASLKAIPDVDLPLIGKVEKPIDQILYIWVQDTSETANDSEKPQGPKGITYSEVQAINRKLNMSKKDGGRELQFKQIKEKLEDKDVVLEAGHHFMLIGKNAKGENTVLLDYVFGKTAPKAPASAAAVEETKEKDNAGANTTDAPAEKPPGPALAPYKKTAGPLSITNIGFEWKGTPSDGALSIIIDASILIGPIGFSLMGFKISFDIKKDTSLRNLPDARVSLDGLAASFNKPPLLIAGAFLHKVENGHHQYLGALTISYGVYLFQAAGYYGEVANSKGGTFNSAFIFCRVNGPLMSIGWAELSGLVAGVGYNSSIKFPTAAQVPSFPLISPPQSANGPLDSLNALMDPKTGGVVTPVPDSFWIAAGVKVTAFQVLKVDAVLVLSFDPTVKIGIFALAVADLPPSPGPGPGKFVHVELGLSATIDVALGVMKIEGQLTPASYILDPNCHLTGGFAMYSWFDSPDPNLNGDWVFSIGGYHRSFQPPAHYPVPERLRISWSFNSKISITGEAYFAITPKACMGGGRLDVTLRAGPLRAWFNAYADFLINYKPFHFMAEAGVSVGIECVVDFCIASFTIGAHLGATLFVQGPPLSGRVIVDFWVASFSVNFGADPEEQKEVALKDFFDLVMQGDTPNALAGGSAPSTPQPHVFNCQAGLVPNGKQETPQDAAWVVRGAGFAFGVSCKFVIEHCTVVTAATKDEKADEKNSLTMSWNDSDDQRFYSKPMHALEPLKSDLEIKIYYESSTTAGTAGHGDEEDGWNKVQRVVRPMPTALWGKYDPATDPTRPDADQSAMLSPAGVTKNLMTGVDIHAPDAKLSAELPIDFNVVDATGQDVFETGKEPGFPNPKLVNSTWTPLAPSKNWKDDAGVTKNEWKSLEKTAKTVVDMWKGLSSFNTWDRTGLQGDAPQHTIDEFEKLYLVMPALTASA